MQPAMLLFPASSQPVKNGFQDDNWPNSNRDSFGERCQTSVDGSVRKHSFCFDAKIRRLLKQKRSGAFCELWNVDPQDNKHRLTDQERQRNTKHGGCRHLGYQYQQINSMTIRLPHAFRFFNQCNNNLAILA